MSTTPGEKPSKLYSLSIFKWDESHPVQVAHHEDMEEYLFYERKKVRKHFDEQIRMVVMSCPAGSKAAVDIKDANGKDRCIFIQVTVDKVAAVALANEFYPNAASSYALTKLLLDFKDHFSENSHLYEDATEDTELEYPKL